MSDQVRPASMPASSVTVTQDDLPPPNTKRWVFRRKATIVRAVHQGVLSADEACKRYQLSIEEFETWQRLVEKHGPLGLRVTRLQDYRD